MTNRFDRDTSVIPVGDGRFKADMNEGWWIVAGPNGGYVAAIMLRALALAVDDEERAPRSLTVHYTSPPEEGPAEIQTVVERCGRGLTTVTARLVQNGKPRAVAIGAFSKARAGVEFQDIPMPVVPPPQGLAPLEPPKDRTIPIRARYESLPCSGDLPYTGSPRALSGAWIRLTEPKVIDSFLVAALTDAWVPAIYPRLAPNEPPVSVPTIDLSVHFRASLPYQGAKLDDFCLVQVRSLTARDGFIEEDCEVWSPTGVLLAQARQLAVMR